jgi:hypothetical protein
MVRLRVRVRFEVRVWVRVNVSVKNFLTAVLLDIFEHKDKG